MRDPTTFALRSQYSHELERRDLPATAGLFSMIQDEQGLTRAEAVSIFNEDIAEDIANVRLHIDDIDDDQTRLDELVTFRNSLVLLLDEADKRTNLSGTTSSLQAELASVESQLTTLRQQRTETEAALASAPTDGLSEREWGNSLNVNPGAWSYAPAVSTDGTMMAVPSSGSALELRSTKTGAVAHRLEGHSSVVTQAAFSPDSTKVATVSYDYSLKIWNTATGALLRTTSLNGLGVTVDWLDETSVLVGIHEKTGLRVNVETGETETIQASGPADVAGLHAVTGYDRTAYRVDLATNTQTTLGNLGVAIYARAASPTHLAAASQAGEIAVWDIASNTRTTLQASGPIVWNLVFSPDGKDLFVSQRDGQILRFSLQTNGTWQHETAASFSGEAFGTAIGIDGTTLIVTNGGPGAVLQAVTLDRPAAAAVMTAAELELELARINTDIARTDRRGTAIREELARRASREGGDEQNEPLTLAMNAGELLTIAEGIAQSSMLLADWRAGLTARRDLLSRIAAGLQETDQAANLHAVEDAIVRIDLALENISSMESAADSLISFGFGARDSDGTLLAEDASFGASIGEQQLNDLSVLSDLPGLASDIMSLLSEESVSSTLDVTGTVRTENGRQTMDLQLELLGGTGMLQVYAGGRTYAVSLGPLSSQLRTLVARLAAGGNADATPLSQQLTWLRTGTLTTRERARHSVAGWMTISAYAMPVYDEWGRNRTPAQPLIVAGDGAVQGQRNNGEGALEFAFDNASYVHALTVRITGKGQSGVLYATTADGRSISRSLGNAGGVVPIGESIAWMRLDAGQSQGVAVVSIDARSTAPTPGADGLPDDMLVIEGGSGALDLSGSLSPVTAVSGVLRGLHAQETIRITAYRGERAVAETQAAADGSFQLGHADGITSIVFHGGSGTLLLTGLNVEGAWGADPTQAQRVSTETTALLSRLSSPNIIFGNWNTASGHKALSVRRVSSGPLTGRWQSNAGYLIDNVDPNRYTLVTLQGGSPEVTGLSYITNTLQAAGYPAESYKAYGNTVLLYPTGRPEMAFGLWIRFSNVTSYSARSADTAAELIPSLAASPHFDLIGRTSFGENGMWGSGITEWPEGSNQSDAFTGHFNLGNTGQTAFTAQSVSVHVGTTGTASDPVTYTLSEQRTIVPGGVLGLHLPVRGVQGQKWGISATLSDGRVITLYQGSGFLKPRTTSPSARRLRTIAADGLAHADRLNLSTSARELYASVIAEYDSTGAVSNQLASSFTSVPNVSLLLAREDMLQTTGNALRAALELRYSLEGSDPSLAAQRAEHKLRSIAANPALYAQLHDVTGFDGSPEAFGRVLVAAKIAEEKTINELRELHVKKDIARITTISVLGTSLTHIFGPLTQEQYTQALKATEVRKSMRYIPMKMQGNIDDLLPLIPNSAINTADIQFRMHFVGQLLDSTWSEIGEAAGEDGILAASKVIKDMYWKRKNLKIGWDEIFEDSIPLLRVHLKLSQDSPFLKSLIHGIAMDMALEKTLGIRVETTMLQDIGVGLGQITLAALIKKRIPAMAKQAKPLSAGLFAIAIGVFGSPESTTDDQYEEPTLISYKDKIIVIPLVRSYELQMAMDASSPEGLSRLWGSMLTSFEARVKRGGADPNMRQAYQAMLRDFFSTVSNDLFPGQSISPKGYTGILYT